MAAVLLGILFPYQALAMAPLGFVFMFLLMLWAGLSVEWSRLKNLPGRFRDVLVGLLFLYLFFPPLQWLLARLLVNDQQYLFGLLFASLTPAAIVSPFFTRVLNGDEELTFLLMVTSMLICPAVAPPMLKLFAGTSIAFEMKSLAGFIVLLVSVPLLISFLISRYIPGIRRRLLPHMGLLNMFTLSLLIYILFGNAASRFNMNYSSAVAIGKILILVFVQDFGVLFLSRFLLAAYYDTRKLNALSTTMSMKNVAIAAAVLLYYDPRAALPPALAFIAHACLFNFIPLAKGFLAGKRGTD